MVVCRVRGAKIPVDLVKLVMCCSSYLRFLAFIANGCVEKTRIVLESI